MKAVISHRIYMDCTAELQDKIDKELTYAIPTHNPLDPPEMIKNMGIIRNGLVSLPIGRTDLIPSNYEIVDRRVNKPVEFPEFRFLFGRASRRFMTRSKITP